MAQNTPPKEPKAVPLIIIERNISELIGADYNPRQLSLDQFKKIEDSLTKFGMVDPVIINTHPDRKNIIVGGHQRTKVWRGLGHDTIPTTEVNLTLEEEKELNVRLNKNTGDWDHEVLIANFDIDDLIVWGFDDDDFKDGQEDEDEEIVAEVEFSEFLNEQNNYVVLFFDNDIDWLQAQTHFDLKTVKSKRGNGKEWSKGVGRVLNGADYLKDLTKDV